MDIIEELLPSFFIRLHCCVSYLKVLLYVKVLQFSMIVLIEVHIFVFHSCMFFFQLPEDLRYTERVSATTAITFVKTQFSRLMLVFSFRFIILVKAVLSFQVAHILYE